MSNYRKVVLDGKDNRMAEVEINKVKMEARELIGRASSLVVISVEEDGTVRGSVMLSSTQSSFILGVYLTGVLRDVRESLRDSLGRGEGKRE